ncbi:MAG TPA: AAA family ATPase [Prosthecobacter sp.]|nr:AAA family ATPase [Prosthecobacter sp.]
MKTMIENIRHDRATLEQVLRSTGATIRGNSLKCPFHDDKTPSASVYQKDGVWRLQCHSSGCGFNGDVFDVRARLESRDVRDLLKEASAEAEPQAKPKRVFPTVDAIADSVAFIGKVEARHCYSNPDTGAVEVVQVRVRDGDGKKSFLTHHAVEGGFVLGAPPKPWPLYNRTRLRDEPVVVLVEGEKCVEVLHKFGIIATTSLSGSKNAANADWSPLAGKTVYIWPDNDEAGQQYAKDAIECLDHLEPRPTLYLMDAEGLDLDPGGDVADFTERYPETNAETIWTLLKDLSVPKGAASELKSHMADIYSGKWRSLKWPSLPLLSRYSKSLFPGTTTMLCGDPGATKSFLLLQCMYEWHTAGTQVALYELEGAKKLHLQRLLAQLAGNGNLVDDEWCRENQVAADLAYATYERAITEFAPRLFSAPLGQLNYESLLKWMQQQCETGCKIIGIDPITAIYTGESRQIEDQTFIFKAQRMLEQYEARLILVTHPRTAKRVSTSQDDLAGGRAFSRHVDTVLWVFRHDPPEIKRVQQKDRVEDLKLNRSIRISKSRHGRGHGFTLAYTFGHSMRFTELGLVVKGLADAMEVPQ